MSGRRHATACGCSGCAPHSAPSSWGEEAKRPPPWREANNNERLPPRSGGPWKRKEISFTPPPRGAAPGCHPNGNTGKKARSDGGAAPPDAEKVSRRNAYRRELYRIKTGIAPILWAERPALALCGLYSRYDTDPDLNGVIQLVKRPRKIKGADGEVTTIERAGLAHVIHCKNPWVCPTCSQFLRVVRAEQVTRAVETWGRGRMFMVTFTTRHYVTDRLDWLLACWSKINKRFFSGKAWDKKRKELGIVGQIRAKEMPYGANGWHVHDHRGVFVETALTSEQLADFESWCFDRLCPIVERVMGPEYKPNRQHGVKVTAMPEGGYLSKFGLELIDIGTKKPKEVRGDVRRTFFEIARDAVDGDAASKALVREYAAATHGEQQIHWSPGLKAMLGIDQEESEDEESDADEKDWKKAEEDGRVIVTLSRDYVERVWSKSCGKRTPFGVPFVPAVLEALEAHDDDADAAAAAWEVLNQVEHHGRDAPVASAEAADAQLAAWGRPVESAKHRRRNKHRQACQHPETCPLCRREHERQCAEKMMRAIRTMYDARPPPTAA